MNKSDEFEQAREIYRTVRLLKARLSKRYAALRDGAAQSAFHELTMPQCNVLTVVRERQAVTIKDLAEALQVSPPSASAMVDRLVDLGMVRREQSRVDRREVLVRISKQGEEAIDSFEAEMLVTIREILEQVGPETAQTWCDVYKRIRCVLDEESAALSPPGAPSRQTGGLP